MASPPEKAKKDRRITFNKKTISKLPYDDDRGKTVIYRDEKFPGFGIHVSGKTGRKTFIVERDIRVPTPEGEKQKWRPCRVTIGPVHEWELADAKERAADLRKQIKEVNGNPVKGRFVATTKEDEWTVQHALDTYLEDRNLRETTANGYRDTMARYGDLLPKGMDTRLADLDAATLRKFYKDIINRVSKKSAKTARPYSGMGAGLSAARTLVILWNFAVDLHGLQLRPNALKKWRDQNDSLIERERMVRFDDLAVFYKGICKLKDPRNQVYVLLLLFAGLRRTEAGMLKWQNIDFTAKTLALPSRVTKGKRTHVLPLPPFVAQLLKDWREIADADSDYVFASRTRTGRPSYLKEPKTIFSDIADETGIKVSPHDLRRDFANVAYDIGLSKDRVGLLLNHSLKGVTGGYISVHGLRKPMDRIANRMVELCKIPDGRHPIEKPKSKQNRRKLKEPSEKNRPRLRKRLTLEGKKVTDLAEREAERLS